MKLEVQAIARLERATIRKQAAEREESDALEHRCSIRACIEEFEMQLRHFSEKGSRFDDYRR